MSKLTSVLESYIRRRKTHFTRPAFCMYGDLPMLSVERCHSLHTRGFTILTFVPNFMSTSIIVSRKGTCHRQMDRETNEMAHASYQERTGH